MVFFESQGTQNLFSVKTKVLLFSCNECYTLQLLIIPILSSKYEVGFHSLIITVVNLSLSQLFGVEIKLSFKVLGGYASISAFKGIHNKFRVLRGGPTNLLLSLLGSRYISKNYLT